MEKYKLEFLPAAQRDLVDIIRYIRVDLANTAAADELTEKFIDAAETAARIPYGFEAYRPIKPLKHEYRRIVVGNYLMFYRINEKEKIISIVAVVYGKREYCTIVD